VYVYAASQPFQFGKGAALGVKTLGNVRADPNWIGFLLACACYEVHAVTITLTRGLIAQIFEHLERAYPNEGGGFLLGRLSRSGDAQIVRIRPIENVAAQEEQYHRYAMTPADWARLEDEADALGLALIGYYHSHPDSPAIPSEYDRAHALPNFRYLIAAVQAAKATELRAWQLAEDRSAFTELALNILEDSQN
jgi:proteasome lid subunit RPN8/RPN11